MINNPTSNLIKIDCATIKKVQSDIIEIEYTNDYFVEIEDVIAVNNIYEKLFEGKPLYSILNTKGKFTTFSKKAQQYLAKDAPIVKNKIVGGSALVIDNLPNRLIGQFFLKFHKPSFPMKIFKNKAEALIWLEILRH